MCGIVGFINFNRTVCNEDSLEKTVSEMNARLVHRGPDSQGIWCDEEQGVALAHRRLAILDLSEHGAQPMASSSGRYIISYNGEIYNFSALKGKLEQKGRQFRGTSDTEVLLAVIEEWGIEAALAMLDGMFAFALWDKKARQLYLCRDRLGEKPLYYGRIGNIFVFASELKALKAHPAFSPEIDRDALALYLGYGYIPSPHSIYKNIFKLPPASFVRISLKEAKETTPYCYWDIVEIAKTSGHSPLVTSFDEAVERLETLLECSVRNRMISDVPLGVFLSGGIDSSLVTALMQKNSPIPVKSFCIGFEESGYNEAQDAAKIAAHLGTDHTEFYVTAREARDVIPDLPIIYDEPFADPSHIPTYHVCRLARKKVTVALSGDGGDESFSGYSRYRLAERLSKLLLPVPHTARRSLQKTLCYLPSSSKAGKLLEILHAQNEEELYRLLIFYWKNPAFLVRNSDDVNGLKDFSLGMPPFPDFAHKMMCFDTMRYLPDDIMVKVDRASMAVSLETRAPFLDHNVIEYAWRLPLAMKKDKKILQAVLGRYVPPSLFERPKQGFGIPHGQWLRGPLRDWAEALLDEARLEREGYLNPAPVRQAWREHLSGRKDWGYRLWSVLMFQAWLERQKL